MVVGDLYHIEDRLKEYCDDLSLVFDYELEQYVIREKKSYVMTVPRHELDARVITRIKEIDMRNGYDVMREIRKHNDKIKKDEESKTADMADQMAKDLRKPFIDSIDYGR